MPQQQAIALWWSHLDHCERLEVLHLQADGFLPERSARELHLHGVRVADVSVAWDLQGLQRTVRVYVQPRVLKEFLSSVRIWMAACEGVLT